MLFSIGFWQSRESLRTHKESANKNRKQRNTILSWVQMFRFPRPERGGKVCPLKRESHGGGNPTICVLGTNLPNLVALAQPPRARKAGKQPGFGKSLIVSKVRPLVQLPAAHKKISAECLVRCMGSDFFVLFLLPKFRRSGWRKGWLTPTPPHPLSKREALVWIYDTSSHWIVHMCEKKCQGWIYQLLSILTRKIARRFVLTRPSSVDTIDGKFPIGTCSYSIFWYQPESKVLDLVTYDMHVWYTFKRYRLLYTFTCVDPNQRTAACRVQDFTKSRVASAATTIRSHSAITTENRSAFNTREVNIIIACLMFHFINSRHHAEHRDLIQHMLLTLQMIICVWLTRLLALMSNAAEVNYEAMSTWPWIECYYFWI